MFSNYDIAETITDKEQAEHLGILTEVPAHMVISNNILWQFIQDGETKLPKGTPFNAYRVNISAVIYWFFRLKGYNAKRNDKACTEADRLYEIAEKRYTENLIDNPDSVLQDIQKILDVLEKQDFIQSREFDLSLTRTAQQCGNMDSYLYHKTLSEENILNCINFIMRSVLYTQIEFAREHDFKKPDTYKKLSDMIKAKLLDWYSFPESEIDRGLQEYFKFFFPVKQEHLKLLPQLRSTLPPFFTMSNTKFSAELENGLINDGKTGLKVGGTKKRPLVTIVTVTDESDAVHSSKSLTMFQTCVKNAAYSLYKYGHSNHVFTPEMIVRTMNGKTETEYISSQQVEAVTKALNELSVIRVRIDATQEAKARKAELNGQLIDTYEREGYLLPLERTKVSAGGKTVEGYQIIKMPVELEYAEMTRQLITVKSELLDIKKVNKAGKATVVSQKSNDERIAVKMYLLSRIKVMIEDRQRKKPKQSNIILFDTLFEKTGIPQNGNSFRYKDYVYDVLDFWTAEKFIKGYTKRKKQGKGRTSIDAIIIHL